MGKARHRAAHGSSARRISRPQAVADRSLQPVRVRQSGGPHGKHASAGNDRHRVQDCVHTVLPGGQKQGPGIAHRVLIGGGHPVVCPGNVWKALAQHVRRRDERRSVFRPGGCVLGERNIAAYGQRACRILRVRGGASATSAADRGLRRCGPQPPPRRPRPRQQALYRARHRLRPPRLARVRQ